METIPKVKPSQKWSPLKSMNGINEKLPQSFVHVLLNSYWGLHKSKDKNVFWDLDWCYGSLVTIVSHLPFCSTISKLSNTSTKIFQRITLSILFAATNLSNRFCFDRIFDEEMFVQKEDLLKIFPARIYHRICQWNLISIKGYCVKNFTTNKLFYM